ncbi:MAG: AAA family ATPase [Verrucomicrobiales bacterium]|nr:AAA family ATPase [Verrucomicrobiales bacterium]
MRITTLDLDNFRCFESFQNPIEFHPRMNVFTANNGAGKSSILDAITVALSPYANSFEHGDAQNFTKADATIKTIEIREGNNDRDRDRDSTAMVRLKASEALYPIRVTSGIEIDSGNLTFETTRRLVSSKGRTNTKESAELQHYAQSVNSMLLDAKNGFGSAIPVISYYGTGRLHAQKKLTAGKKLSSVHNPRSRTMGYLDCLSPESSYKHFQEWMKKTTLAQNQESAPGFKHGASDIYQDMLDGVSKSIDIVLESLDWEEVHYSIYSDELLVSDGSKWQPLAILSDGLRSMIAMIGDLAYRCIMLNPQFAGEAPLQTPGIVLIDEIEMHLHPSWQQQIIGQLQEAFPKIQFICTTHSPQVLSTVKQESIRIISDAGEILPGEEAGVNSYGAQSYFILEDLMKVSSNPRIPEVEKLKDSLKQLLQQSTLNLDHSELGKLENMIGAKDPFIRNLKASIIRKGKERA